MIGLVIGITGALIIVSVLYFLRHTLKTFPSPFWIANSMELMERMAFFGVRAVLPLYMIASVDQHGLGITYAEKGIIYGIWAAFQCLLPIVSGGFTDNFGYKKSLYTAFTLNTAGYITMAFACGFWSMLASAIMVGTGTAIFKPPVQGTVAKTVTAENSSIGFGMFYWIVNIGGVIGPICAAYLRGNEANPTWKFVFFGAAIVTAFNFLPSIFFFKEPELTGKGKTAKGVLKETALNLWHDKNLLLFLLITSGFWLMFMQLWDLLPNFIEEWVDSGDIAPIFTSIYGTDALTALGNVKPELIINIDYVSVVVFVVLVSKITGRFKMMFSLLLGMAVSTLSFFGSGFFQSGAMVAFMIFLFSIGEIICSPKFNEYVGMSAPADKKALYMGYSNMPFAFGWMTGNFISGPLYSIFSSKANLSRDYLITALKMPAEEAAKIKDGDVFNVLVATIHSTPQAATKMLWDTYNPWIIWLFLSLIGVASIIGLILLDMRIRKGK